MGLKPWTPGTPDPDSTASDAIVGRGHPEIDRRSLEMVRRIVERVDADPTLIVVAHDNLERWRARRGGVALPCWAEWEDLLEERSWAEIREILLDPSDEGQRLRSSHPFVGILDREERRAIHDAYRAGAHHSGRRGHHERE